MHWLGEKPSRLVAKFVCPLLLLVALAAAPARTAQADHGFNKGNWPFRPLERPAAPTPANADWVANPIDQFILADLEKRSLEPNWPADRTTLLRRVTFDLTGLPPTPEELEAFLADRSPEAYERVVDRLLASPRFGERWARHWLDIVRFADTAGFRPDFLRPEAYRYRDYVIRAFNSDLPYDRFVRQQIAGDELEPGNPDALIATGFLRLFPQEGFAANFIKQRQDVLDDVTEVTGLAFLGLTLGCAKCHDHKFDPIEQTDFFRLQACFSAIVPRDDAPPVTPEIFAEYQKQQGQWEEATADIRRQIDWITTPLKQDAYDNVLPTYDAETREAWLTPDAQRTTRQRQFVALSSRYMNGAINKRINKLDGELRAQYDALQVELAQFDSLKPAPLPASMSVCDGPGPAPETHVLDAGDYRKPEETVSPGFPEFLGEEEATDPKLANAAGGRRSSLARWLTLTDHPLTARVVVNRLWQHHFGQGIVATSNDFGSMGDDPTDPQLLDWLACELVDQSFSLKAVHRIMVLSATYQQSSRVDPESPAHQRAINADPLNKLLWHARRCRLEGEVVRDSLYAVSGRLDLTMYGPSVYLRLPSSVLNFSRFAWTPDPVEANLNRRSVYSFQMRNMRHPLLASFDQPDLYISCGTRMNTLTPTQSLALFNGEETAEQATWWAGRLLAQSSDDSALIRQAWLEAYGRSPTDDEFNSARQFLMMQADRIYTDESNVPTSSQPQPCPSCLEPQKAAAYVDLCHALMNSTEFLFVD
jgi:Protein of unknown function (DUF1549)/Protein of unknown function (DUF1553)